MHKILCLFNVGIMGKRTRFQEEDKAQLVLQVTREDGVTTSENGDNLQVPVPAADMPKVSFKPYFSEQFVASFFL